jgi:hypothetical protein
MKGDNEYRPYAGFSRTGDIHYRPTTRREAMLAAATDQHCIPAPAFWQPDRTEQFLSCEQREGVAAPLTLTSQPVKINVGVDPAWRIFGF